MEELFRIEAQERVTSMRLQKLKTIQLTQRTKSNIKSPRNKQDIDISSFHNNENMTPKIAALAEADFSLNGCRARSDSREFVGPRYIPDAETTNCTLCQSEFDWWTRKHHCRHCGKIFCQKCSVNKTLLPILFELRDPQRVCQECYEIQQPHQIMLANNIANHQRTNAVDIVSDGLRRYLNLPVSMTLEVEIRKACYSTYNLFRKLYYILDKTIPLGLLKDAKGLAFITVVKGGFIIAPRLGE